MSKRSITLSTSGVGEEPEARAVANGSSENSGFVGGRMDSVSSWHGAGGFTSSRGETRGLSTLEFVPSPESEGLRFWIHYS